MDEVNWETIEVVAVVMERLVLALTTAAIEEDAVSVLALTALTIPDVCVSVFELTWEVIELEADWRFASVASDPVSSPAPVSVLVADVQISAARDPREVSVLPE